MAKKIKAMTTQEKQSLPDITLESSPTIIKTIDKVGMTNITCPIQIKHNNTQQLTPAKINIFINLDNPSIKGIHMSRLYTTTINHFENNPFNQVSIKNCLEKLIKTHPDCTNKAYLEINYDYIIKQSSLSSNLSGYRSYPISISAENNNNTTTYTTQFTITYSSTCPCSAALSRQAIQEKFEEDHPYENSFSKETILEWISKESSITATPHAQRSYAKISISHSENHNIDILEYINQAESLLETAVQTVVKREDEKLFAIKNATHLMFCEDAIRKLDQWLESIEILTDYSITVNHHESLHPHNATASTRKKLNK
ncbi:GTP cyclohydrolase I FolE2 [bacterium]|nr:GTP cyclohydrolase I FolE2 [Actinomycetota bacterium]MBE33809.1 GTP cyclohydrolase I FolE2 [bacterium]